MLWVDVMLNYNKLNKCHVKQNKDIGIDQVEWILFVCLHGEDSEKVLNVLPELPL